MAISYLIKKTGTGKTIILICSMDSHDLAAEQLSIIMLCYIDEECHVYKLS